MNQPTMKDHTESLAILYQHFFPESLSILGTRQEAEYVVI